VNNINTHEGGSISRASARALTRTINEWAKKDGLLRRKIHPHGDDIREGLTACCT